MVPQFGWTSAVQSASGTLCHEWDRNGSETGNGDSRIVCAGVRADWDRAEEERKKIG